jgi:hypothetical protein
MCMLLTKRLEKDSECIKVEQDWAKVSSDRHYIKYFLPILGAHRHLSRLTSLEAQRFIESEISVKYVHIEKVDKNQPSGSGSNSNHKND